MTTSVAKLQATTLPRAAPPENLLAVVLDHAHARFFLVAGDEVRELECLVSPRMRGGRFHSDRQGSPGWGEGGFHGRRREEERRHYTAVVRRLGALLRLHRSDAVVIGGTKRVIAEFRGLLPAGLARNVLGVALVNATAVSTAALRRAVESAREAAVAAAQRAWVAALIDAFGKERAVDGVRPVLEALERNQVRALVVQSDFTREGFRGARSGRLMVSKDTAAAEPVVRVPNLIAAALEEARRQHAPVIVVRDRRLTAQFDGIAALLRYR